jgi:hypothetical protein
MLWQCNANFQRIGSLIDGIHVSADSVTFPVS